MPYGVSTQQNKVFPDGIDLLWRADFLGDLDAVLGPQPKPSVDNFLGDDGGWESFFADLWFGGGFFYSILHHLSGSTLQRFD